MSVGSASWPLYDCTNLACNNDVVVVGINHRLGVLGFLHLSHLGDEFADSGNVGMLDIVAALEWVRDNIAQFGGDPANVTIFGESGGGSKVTCLLGMPSAQGLFRSAFAMSGAMLDVRTPEAARETSDLILERLGVGTDVEALRKLDVEAYVQASARRLRWRRRPLRRRSHHQSQPSSPSRGRGARRFARRRQRRPRLHHARDGRVHGITRAVDRRRGIGASDAQRHARRRRRAACSSGIRGCVPTTRLLLFSC